MKIGSLVERVGEYNHIDYFIAATQGVDMPRKGVPYTVSWVGEDEFNGKTKVAIKLEECNGIYAAEAFRELQSPEDGMEVVEEMLAENLEVAV